MRTVIESFNVYSFDELSTEAKQKALDSNREINIYDEWYEGIYMDTKLIAGAFGLRLDEIYLSGFWSQGDGACFTGSYSYKKDSLSLLKSYLGENAEQSEPYRIAKALQEIQRKQFYSVECEIAQRGMYSHSHTMYLSSFDAKRYDETENDVLRCFRAYADWIYKSLQQEYEYQTSDDAVKEQLQEFEFTENGKIFI